MSLLIPMHYQAEAWERDKNIIYHRSPCALPRWSVGENSIYNRRTLRLF